MRDNREQAPWEPREQQPFDLEAEEKRRHQERPPSQARSPGLPREVEEKVEEKQASLGEAPWGGGAVEDWVEDVEQGDARAEFETRDEGREYERPNRPNSRDSTVSKDSRGSRDGKGRSSRDRELGFPQKTKEDGKAKQEAPPAEEAKAKGGRGKAPGGPPDLRGYFPGQEVERKLQHRQAPGPITRDRLDQAEVREGMTQMTQLKKGANVWEKRQEAKVEEKVVAAEEAEKVATSEVTAATMSLINPDMLENISDDEESFDAADVEKVEAVATSEVTAATMSLINPDMLE